VAVNLHSTHYRFGIAELAESTHGWHAALDANPAQGVIAVDTTFLLRFTVQETGGTAAGNTDQQFQCALNGGAFQNITTTSTIVKAVTTTVFANGADLTKRLTGTGTFESSGDGGTHDGLSGGAQNDIAASGNSETECALQIVSADVANDDVITFRLTSPDFTITNDVVPTLTVAESAPVVVIPTTATLALTTFAPTVTATGPTALLVVGDAAAPTASDNIVKGRLQGLGFQVTLISDETAADTSKDLVVQAESCASATLAGKYSTFAGPLVDFEPGVVDDCDMASVGATVSGAGEDNAVILDAGHDMAAGLSSTVAVFSPADFINFNNASELVASAQQVYSTEASGSQIVGYAYETGATMQNSHVAEGRRVFCGLGADGSLDSIAANGLALIDAAISWAFATPGDITVTPGVASLALTTFAPTVTASDHKLVTPTTASLTLTTFAPSVTVGVNVVPATASLTLTAFAPTVGITDHQLVTPGTAGLTLAAFAPTVTASDHQTAVPTTASLSLTAFAPTIVLTDHQLVTPSTASLVLTTFAPNVTGDAGLTVVPGVASLALTTFAPTVSATDHQLVTPGVTSLTLTTFVPVVTSSDHILVSPTTASLTLTAFAPLVSNGGATVTSGHGPDIAATHCLPMVIEPFHARPSVLALHPRPEID
jgi:hypothetical protein